MAPDRLQATRVTGIPEPASTSHVVIMVLNRYVCMAISERLRLNLRLNLTLRTRTLRVQTKIAVWNRYMFSFLFQAGLSV